MAKRISRMFGSRPMLTRFRDPTATRPWYRRWQMQAVWTFSSIYCAAVCILNERSSLAWTRSKSTCIMFPWKSWRRKTTAAIGKRDWQTGTEWLICQAAWSWRLASQHLWLLRCLTFSMRPRTIRIFTTCGKWTCRSSQESSSYFRPSIEEHSSFIKVEPMTGIILEAAKRFQLNTFVSRNFHPGKPANNSIIPGKNSSKLLSNNQ